MFSPLLGRSNLTSFSINAFKSPLFATIFHIIFLGKFRLAPEISQPKNRWWRWKVSMTTTGVRLIHPWHVNHPWPGEKCPWDVKLGWCRLLGISEWCTLGGWRKQALFFCKCQSSYMMCGLHNKTIFGYLPVVLFMTRNPDWYRSYVGFQASSHILLNFPARALERRQPLWHISLRRIRVFEV